jgi:hypothetical protein
MRTTEITPQGSGIPGPRKNNLMASMIAEDPRTQDHRKETTGRGKNMKTQRRSEEGLTIEGIVTTEIRMSREGPVKRDEGVSDTGTSTIEEREDPGPERRMRRRCRGGS